MLAIRTEIGAVPLLWQVGGDRPPTRSRIHSDTDENMWWFRLFIPGPFHGADHSSHSVVAGSRSLNAMNPQLGHVSCSSNPTAVSVRPIALRVGNNAFAPMMPVETCSCCRVMSASSSPFATWSLSAGGTTPGADNASANDVCRPSA